VSVQRVEQGSEQPSQQRRTYLTKYGSKPPYFPMEESAGRGAMTRCHPLPNG